MRSFLLLPLALLAACSDPPPAPKAWQGYAEGEFVLVASPYGGNLDKLAVARGQQVTAGAGLFRLEQANEAAGRQQAEAQVAAAQARMHNLAEGRRAPEVQAVQAQQAQATAARRLSDVQLKQQEALFARGFISQSALDQARANHDRDQARLAESGAQLATARLPLGRPAEQAAAQADLAAAQQNLAQAQWRLAQKTITAPAAGLIQDTYYVQGEWVPAGAPVISLLPPANIKLRFFVPQGSVGSLKPGQAVQVSCDGCGAAIPARISFISPQPEYTPPVIYSRESRAKLVFMLEARPSEADAARLKPGQPVDVSPAP